MKTIGLLGGMSWESTVLYYQLVNRAVAHRLGGLHSAQVLLYSVDFHDVEVLQREARWEEAGALLAEAAAALERGGAQCIVVCTNTMHKVSDAIEARVGIPLLHIADPTADAILRAGCHRAGLLGTRFTMEQDFYRARLQRRGIDVVIPDKPDRDRVHDVIYDELCRGEVRDDSRAAYRAILAKLVAAGAQCIVLGCTEIGMLVGAADASVPIFDTTVLHAQAAARFALGEALPG